MSEKMIQSGCRYWPRTKGPFFWAGGVGDWPAALWDEGECREELHHLADLGFDLVRVALPWEAVQPTTGRLRALPLDRLGLFLEWADEATLQVEVTVAGQLGGTLFVPAWLLATDPATRYGLPTRRVVAGGWDTPWPLANLYEARPLLEAQGYLWRELAHNFGTHPALARLDPGAGGLLGALPPRDPAAAWEWWTQITEEAAAAPLGYSDGPALLMEPRAPALAPWRATVGHLALATTVRAGHANDAAVAWPLFQLRVTQAIAGGSVGCAAVGLPTRPLNAPPDPPATHHEARRPTPWFTEEEQARFFHELLPRLVAGGVPTVCHAVWADAPPALHGLPPFDTSRLLRHSGLLRADGSEKEAATIWRTFHTQRAPLPAAPPPLDLDPEEWQARRGDPAWLQQLFDRFRHGEL